MSRDFFAVEIGVIVSVKQIKKFVLEPKDSKVD